MSKSRYLCPACKEPLTDEELDDGDCRKCREPIVYEHLLPADDGDDLGELPF